MSKNLEGKTILNVVFINQIVKNCKNAPLYHFVGPGAVASWREKWGKHAKVTKSAIRLQKVKRLERLKAKGLFFVARIWT